MLHQCRTHRKPSFAKLHIEWLEDRTVPSAFYQVETRLFSPVGVDGRYASGDAPVSASQNLSILPGGTGTNYFEGYEFAAAGPDALGASASIVENITPVGLMGPTGHGGHGESFLRYDDIVISGPPGSVTISLNLQFSGAPSVRAFNALPEATFIGAFDATAEIRVEGHLGFHTDLAAGPLQDFAGRIVSSGGWDGSFGGIGIGGVTTSGILHTPSGNLTTDPVAVPTNTTLSLTLDLLAGGGLDAYVLGTGPVQPSLTFEIHNEGVTLGLPTVGPVFNLPLGYTVNSPEAGIVNNVIPPPAPSQAAPTVKVTDAGGTYNGQSFPATATATDANGAPVNGSFTITYTDGQSNTSADPPTHAGAYTVVASFISANPNFTDGQSSPVTFTINLAPLTISADNQTKLYGAPLPPLTATITGLVAGDTPATFSNGHNVPPTVSTTATQTSDVVAGGYPIAVSGAVDPDYTITYVNGTLTITPANQIITWSNPAPITVGTPLSSTQLNATVSVVGPAPAGALTYTPPAGTILGPGSGQSLSVSAAATGDYCSATATVTINVLYNFIGFLAPLDKNLSFAANRTVSIKFQLTDAFGHYISNLSAITALQVVYPDAS